MVARSCGAAVLLFTWTETDSAAPSADAHRYKLGPGPEDDKQDGASSMGDAPPRPRLLCQLGRVKPSGGGPHASPVTALAFSPSGLRLVSGCEDGRLVLWDLSRAEALARAPSIALSAPASRRPHAAPPRKKSGARHGNGRTAGRRSGRRSAHAGAVTSVSFADELTFVSTGGDGCAAEWCIVEGARSDAGRGPVGPGGSLISPSNSVASLASSVRSYGSATSTVAAAMRKHGIRIAPLRPAIFMLHPGPVTCAAIAARPESAGGASCVISGCVDGTVSFWDTHGTRGLIAAISASDADSYSDARGAASDAVVGLAVSPCSRYLLTATAGTACHLWDIVTLFPSATGGAYSHGSRPGRGESAEPMAQAAPFAAAPRAGRRVVRDPVEDMLNAGGHIGAGGGSAVAGTEYPGGAVHLGGADAEIGSSRGALINVGAELYGGDAEVDLGGSLFHAAAPGALDAGGVAQPARAAAERAIGDGFRATHLHALPHSSPCVRVAFTSDSVHCVTTSRDCTTRLWRVRDGQMVYQVNTPVPIHRLVVHGDGRGSDTLVAACGARLLLIGCAGARHSAASAVAAAFGSGWSERADAVRRDQLERVSDVGTILRNIIQGRGYGEHGQQQQKRREDTAARVREARERHVRELRGRGAAEGSSGAGPAMGSAATGSRSRAVRIPTWADASPDVSWARRTGAPGGAAGPKGSRNALAAPSPAEEPGAGRAALRRALAQGQLPPEVLARMLIHASQRQPLNLLARVGDHPLQAVQLLRAMAMCDFDPGDVLLALAHDGSRPLYEAIMARRSIDAEMRALGFAPEPSAAVGLAGTLRVTSLSAPRLPHASSSSSSSSLSSSSSRRDHASLGLLSSDPDWDDVAPLPSGSLRAADPLLRAELHGFGAHRGSEGHGLPPWLSPASSARDGSRSTVVVAETSSARRMGGDGATDPADPDGSPAALGEARALPDFPRASANGEGRLPSLTLVSTLMDKPRLTARARVHDEQMRTFVESPRKRTAMLHALMDAPDTESASASGGSAVSPRTREQRGRRRSGGGRAPRHGAAASSGAPEPEGTTSHPPTTDVARSPRGPASAPARGIDPSLHDPEVHAVLAHRPRESMSRSAEHDIGVAVEVGRRIVSTPLRSPRGIVAAAGGPRSDTAAGAAVPLGDAILVPTGAPLADACRDDTRDTRDTRRTAGGTMRTAGASPTRSPRSHHSVPGELSPHAGRLLPLGYVPPEATESDPRGIYMLGMSLRFDDSSDDAGIVQHRPLLFERIEGKTRRDLRAQVILRGAVSSVAAVEDGAVSSPAEASVIDSDADDCPEEKE